MRHLTLPGEPQLDRQKMDRILIMDYRMYESIVKVFRHRWGQWAETVPEEWALFCVKRDTGIVLDTDDMSVYQNAWQRPSIDELIRWEGEGGPCTQ